MKPILATLGLLLLAGTVAVAQETINLGTVQLQANTAGQSFDIPITGTDQTAGMNFYFRIGGGTGGPKITAVNLPTASTIWGATGIQNDLGGGDDYTALYGVVTSSGTVLANGVAGSITVDTTGVAAGSYSASFTVLGFPTEILDVGGTPLPLTLVDGTLVVPHVITASAGANGSISPSGTVQVNPGADRAFTITADPGHHIVDVLVDTVSQGAIASYTFTSVDANHTISATFAADPPGTHVLTVNFGSGDGSYVADAIVPIIADAPVAGQVFAAWVGDITNVANTAAASTTITMPAADAEITATYAPASHTVTFDLDGKGTRTGGGTLVQSIEHGNAATAPTVVGNAGWIFTGWDVPFDNIADALTVTAQYDAATYVVTFQTDATPGVTVNGVTSLTQAVAHGDDAAAVTAAAPASFHFVNWTHDGANYSIVNPLTVSNVVEAMTLVANFAADVTHTVVFVALEGGTVDGAARVTQTVVDGEDCAPVEAIPAADCEFTGWSGDAVGADATITVTNVTTAMTVYANFAAAEKVAVGLLFPVSAAEANVPGGVFSKAPKVWATYHDPVKDPLGMKIKKASAKVVTKILKGTTVASVDVEWKKKVRLYDLKAFKGEQKIGTSVVLWLENNPVRDLNVDLQASGKENKVPYADGIRTVALACPQLDAVRDAGDTTDVTDLAGREGQQLLLKGRWFGNKPPKVWLEYPLAGKLKALKLKAIKPYAFDVNGKVGVSVMDNADGASEMLVQLPDVLPADIAAIVIENGVGLDCLVP